jgi:foldase protein PrsA
LHLPADCAIIGRRSIYMVEKKRGSKTMKSKKPILVLCAVLVVIAAALLIIKPWDAKQATADPTDAPVVTEVPTEAPTDAPTATPTEVPAATPVTEATDVPDTTADAEDDTADDSTVLAVVDGKEILLSDAQYYAELLYYYGYTDTENDYDYAVEYLVNQEIVSHYITKAGLDQFTDEEKAAFDNEAAEEWEEMISSYIENYLTEDTQEQRDSLRLQAIAYYEDYGYTQEKIANNLMLQAEYDRLDDQLANGYTPTEDEITAVFNEYGEQYREQYEGNVPLYEFYTQYYGAESWYVPEGYRAILHILLTVDDDLLTAYTEAQNAYDEAEGAETPDAEAIAAAQTALDTAREAVLAYVQPKLDDIYARLEKGESFQTLIAEYGEDPGMQDEETLAAGYPVHKDSIIYDSAFTQGAFQDKMAKVGDYSDPVIGSYGVHVLYYLADMEGGLVMTDEIHEEIADYLVNSKVNEAYTAGLTEWKADMDITVYQDVIDSLTVADEADTASSNATFTVTSANTTSETDTDTTDDTAAETKSEE